jgi:hypothetical protein
MVYRTTPKLPRGPGVHSHGSEGLATAVARYRGRDTGGGFERGVARKSVAGTHIRLRDTGARCLMAVIDHVW